MDNLNIISKYSKIYDGIKNNIEQIKDRIKIERNVKQEDTKILYNNISKLSDIILNLKQKYNIYNIFDKYKDKKEKLIKSCEEEINLEIQYIIYFSYVCFRNNINLKKGFKNILIDIQKSTFYSDNKDNKYIKIMEDYTKVYDIISEVSKEKNYIDCYKNLLDIEKSIYNVELRNEIEKNLKICKKGICKNKIIEAKKYIEQNFFEYAIKTIEDLIIDLYFKKIYFHY